MNMAKSPLCSIMFLLLLYNAVHLFVFVNHHFRMCNIFQILNYIVYLFSIGITVFLNFVILKVELIFKEMQMKSVFVHGQQ